MVMDSRQRALAAEADAERYPAERSEIMLDAAAAWRAAGEIDRAAEIYRELAEVRDEHGLYAMIELVEHHFAHGEPEQAGELLRRLRRDPLLDDGHCMITGELLEIRGDLAAAERWLGRGAALLSEEQLDEMQDSPAPDATVAGMLLNSRRRVRQSLGREPDMLDDLAPAEIPMDPDERLRHIAEAMDVDRPLDETAPKDPPRNAPCPCGSGRKYKKCCGSPAQPAG